MTNSCTAVTESNQGFLLPTVGEKLEDFVRIGLVLDGLGGLVTPPPLPEQCFAQFFYSQQDRWTA